MRYFNPLNSFDLSAGSVDDSAWLETRCTLERAACVAFVTTWASAAFLSCPCPLKSVLWESSWVTRSCSSAWSLSAWSLGGKLPDGIAFTSLVFLSVSELNH